MIKRWKKTAVTVFFIIVILTIGATPAFASPNEEPKNVLILHAQDQFLPANMVMDKTFYATLKSSKEINVSIFSEYLESVRFDSISAQTDIVSLLHKKYGSMKLDLIIVTDDVSWDFLAKNQKDLFKGIPTVFCGITKGKIDPKTLSNNITGNFKYLDIVGNIDLILRVQPKTKEIDVVVGTSPQDQAYEKLTRKAFEIRNPNVKVNYLVGFSIDETKKRISELPEDAVVLYVAMYTDGAGKGFNPRDVVPMLREASKVPIYGVSDTYLGYGILGGKLLSFADLSKDASELAMKVLIGEEPSNVPIKVLENKNYFDWNEVSRFNIKRSDIPIGSVIINKNPTMWEQYKLQIVILGFFITSEAGLILFLLIQLKLKRMAKKKLDDMNESLEQMIQERTSQLEIANKELESFSYSVSHDLRSPLRHMIGFVELLNGYMPEQLDEKGRHYLSVISESAMKMSELIDSLLAFSRMGKTEMRHENVDLNEILRGVLEIFSGETKNRSIEWNIMELPEVSGDKNMLQLVFTNLISNALKFTRGKPLAKIEVGVKPDIEQEDKILLYVKDNGAGFDMQYEDKLFGIFQRLHNQKDFEGNGVGLANVSRIINRHGGKVWADARLNEGATFYFTLLKAEEKNHD